MDSSRFIGTGMTGWEAIFENRYMSPIIEEAEVIAKTVLSPDLFVFILSAPRISAIAKPGQFVQIDPGDKFFLRRPFSIQDAYGDEIEILIKVVGEGTQALVNKESPWNLIGPLGNSFTINPDTTPILVAGGVGVAPLKFLAIKLLEKDISFHFFVGARTPQDNPIHPDDKINSIVNYAFDEGADSFQGTVVQYISKYLITIHKPAFFQACGPLLMLAELRRFMISREFQGEFSLESRMACGMGICQGCAVPVKGGYKLVCKDGAVFPFDEIDGSYWK